MKQRLFIAVALGDDIARGCKTRIAQLKAKPGTARVNWVVPENLHITLKFLGDVPSESISAIQQVLLQVAGKYQPQEIQIGGIGTFPNEGSVQTIWINVANDSSLLSDLARDLNHQLEQLGFASEKKEFVAHVSLGRVKAGKFPRAALKEVSHAVIGSVSCGSINELLLMESKTYPSGPVYSVLSRAVLGR